MRWLVLIHQLPPSPAYLRVKVGRHLARIGAVALKNSVYVLPRGEDALEDFAWVRAEILAGGGDATLLDADFVEGIGDEEITERFRQARDEEYRDVAEEARALMRDGTGREPFDGAVRRLARRLEEIRRIDFFAATGYEVAGALVRALAAPPQKEKDMLDLQQLKKRVWVTRAGMKVDRLACAWLIRRFIDPEARFKFVEAQGYKPLGDELRFDMFEGELTHEADRCSFEVLCRRAGLDQPALEAIAEIVHDIDLKDGKYGRPETAGVAAMIAGLARGPDEERLQRGATVFDALYAALGAKA